MASTKKQMAIGKCYYCGNKGEIAIKQWDGSKYANCCTVCAEKYMNDQYVGMVTRRDYPNIYYGKLKHKDDVLIGVYSGPSGMQPIYGPRSARKGI